MFDRVIKLIGEEKFKHLKDKTVLVVGLGGVGGYVCEGLIRSGIGNIILVDYDSVDISNLNRQIISNINNIGLDKVDVMDDRIKSINPDCNVIKLNIKLDEENVIDIFNNYTFDYVIDACDTIVVKEMLIKLSCQYNINIISSMGTGNKFNSSMLSIMDLRKTSYDPIARRLRKFVKDNKINKKIPVVCSTEKNDSFTGDVPSMIFVPAVAGLMCANYVINDIIDNI